MWPEEKYFPPACLLTVLFPLLLVSTVASDVALIVIAVLFLVHSAAQKQWGWCQEDWVRLLALLWLYMIARGLFAEHPRQALGRALPFVRYIVFAAALARWTLRDEATRRRFLFVLTGMVIACALDGLLQYLTGYDLSLHPTIRDPGGTFIRLTGPFTKPILGIMLSWFAFPVLLPLLRRSNPAPALACLFAVTAAIALSGERMALLLEFFGLLMAGLLLRPGRRFILAGCAGMAVLLGLLALASPITFTRQVESTQRTLAHWQQSPYGLLLESDLTLAKQHPVIGIGAGHFHERCEALYGGNAARSAVMCSTHPHNIWLEWLIEEGIIGLALFAAFVVTVLRDCIRAWPRAVGNPLFAGLVIAFVLRVWPLMSTTGFFSRWGAPPFWLVLGALLVYTAGKEAKNASAPFAVQGSGL